MNSELRFPVKLRLRSPFLFKSIEASGFGIDAPAMRGSDGQPLLPGDHLRGHLSHAIRALGKTDAAIYRLHEYLFGARSSEADLEKGQDASDVPIRGRIDVPDFRAEPLPVIDEVELACEDGDALSIPLADHGALLAVRVEIDAPSGAAKEGHLQFVELVAPPGAVVTFVGTIGVRADAKEEAFIHRVLSDSFRLIRTIGAGKTIGFGEVLVEHSTVSPHQKEPIECPAPPTDGDRFEVTVAFDRPILVDAWANASNLYRGSTIVPGGAIKGALATTLSNRAPGAEGELGDDLGKALGEMLVSHAFPLLEAGAEGELADRSPPLSLVAAKCRDGRIRFAEAFDPAAVDALISPPADRQAEGTDRGIAHSIDWKGDVEEAVRRSIGRPASRLVRVPRGRVAIDEKGVADKGKLFVAAPVETAGCKWRFIVDRNGSSDDAFRNLLTTLSGCIGPVGRTGARMRVLEWRSADAPSPSPIVLSIDGREREVHVLCLETPAMLTDPCCELGWKEQYEAAFTALGGEHPIELVTHFARRKTVGGYLSHRFRRRGPGVYVTSELTMPGSVFVLAGHGADAFTKEALARGLAPVQFRDGKAEILEDWRKTPFVAANGWGRISVTRVQSGVRVAAATVEEG